MLAQWAVLENKKGIAQPLSLEIGTKKGKSAPTSSEALLP